MSEGIRSDGRKIGRYRPPNGRYAKLKNSMNSKPGSGFVDLKLTGSFYEAVVVDVSSEAIEFTSTDPKTPMLEDKYSSKIFGLSEPWHNQMIEKIEPEFISLYREAARL